MHRAIERIFAELAIQDLARGLLILKPLDFFKKISTRNSKLPERIFFKQLHWKYKMEIEMNKGDMTNKEYLDLFRLYANIAKSSPSMFNSFIKGISVKFKTYSPVELVHILVSLNQGGLQQEDIFETCIRQIDRDMNLGGGKDFITIHSEIMHVML